MQIIFDISKADAKVLHRCEYFKKPMRMLKADAKSLFSYGDMYMRLRF
jgi:hypothetical protein